MGLLAGNLTDEQVERYLSGLLRAGVLLAAAVTGVGGLFYLMHAGGRHADYTAFHGVSRGLDSVVGVLRGVRALRAEALIQLGLLLLIATPITRVALSLLAFAREGDRTYVLITTFVLALLLLSLFGAGAG